MMGFDVPPSLTVANLLVEEKSSYVRVVDITVDDSV